MRVPTRLMTVSRLALMGMGAVSALLAVPCAASATTLHVSETSLCTLEHAIVAMNLQDDAGDCQFDFDGSADRIVLQAGNYLVDANLDVSRSVELVGSGRGATVIEAGDDYAFGVFANGALSPRLTLRDLSVVGASFQSAQATGIYLEAEASSQSPVSLALHHVEIRGFEGYGVELVGYDDTVSSAPSIDILDSLIEDNQLGGVRSLGGALSVTRSHLTSNGGPGLEREGVHHVTFVDSLIHDNDGAGVTLVGGSLDMFSSIVSHNRAGGIRGMDYAIAMYSSLVDHNTTSEDGAGIHLAGLSGFQIHSSTISNNEAQGDGGGLFLENHGTANLWWTTVSNNRAARGGGICYIPTTTGYFAVNNSTIAENHAHVAGGGLFAVIPSEPDPVELRGSIAAHNTVGTAQTPSDVSGELTTLNSWLGVVGSDTDLVNILGSFNTGDPGLGALRYVDGLPFIKVHPLLAGSPALDLSANASPQTGVDGRGRFGAADGDGDGTAVWDLGAFELNRFPAMWLISDFELTDQPWVGTGGATLATTREHAFEGYQSLLVTNRNGYPWQGAEHDLTGMVSPNTLYQIGAQVRVASNSSEPVLLTLKSTCAGMSPVYTTIDAGTATNTGWTPLLGAVTLPTCDLEQVSFYVEGPSAGVDLYIDDVFAFRFAFDPPELAGGFVVTTDWGSGYCVELEVQNNHTAATVDWSARFNLNGASIYAIWNLDATASAGEVTVTPNAEWSRVIPAGASSHSLGFCANRPSGGSSLPSPPLLGVTF